MNRETIKNPALDMQIEEFAYFQYMLFAEYTAGDGDQAAANHFAGIGSGEMVYDDANKVVPNKLNHSLER